ncbi:peroxiredoxin [Lewinella marina]|uniref:Alkyl hydroperoxide reductase n=1 Tax=Neolewinella marina TaxID=438751 RepID=A0A2G0CFW5_9BACT|nr:TlpA disulfide reductase family protein [Neolewinella marina]NJB85451.1 peroxiredoxin [Neolewinella marina]PHK98858.1 alkyl hydroperoxide reductase [Neolewinella marina]
MIRTLLPLLGLIGLLLSGCDAGSPDGTSIQVHLNNANGLSANLDRINIAGEKEMLKSTSIDENGNFAFDFAEPLPDGLYQIRVGAQKATVALDDTDGEVTIDGDLATFSNYEFTIEGSPAAKETLATMQGIQEVAGLEEFQEMIEKVENDYTAAYVTFRALQRAGEAGVPLHEAVITRLPEGDASRQNYTTYLEQLKQQIAFARSQELIQPGQPAPDLVLESPDGEKVALSDLRGKVVLLDFWAAWCGPCRRENPNVVKVYNKYKDQGFTIYSVSLDGIDDNQAARLTPEQLEVARENQRQKWVAAIEQDGLVWENHGSELKRWSGEASAKYGVRGIPATFLIDREGKIAEIGLRGAASIERALQQVL